MLHDTYLERVQHHAGNGAQILYFIHDTHPDLHVAYLHMKKACELIRGVHSEKTIRVHDDSEISREDVGQDSQALHQTAVPRSRGRVRPANQTPAGLGAQYPEEGR